MGERITTKTPVEDGLEILRKTSLKREYYITNTERDLSQSDFKNRILPHTEMFVAEEREATGYFSLEITGGASVHVDMLRKQINPFERLQILRQKMPDTPFQTLCRGVNLFGYRPYPENVIRFTVRKFAQYVDVWRIFDYLNYIPNMIPVYEEVRAAGKYLQPAICFSTGPEHTNNYYLKKVKEILEITGPEIILCIKNHSGIGTPKRIASLIGAIKNRFPELIIHYHGHNTDGFDSARIVAAVKAGANIIDAGDHAMTGFYGPPPILSVIEMLESEGYTAAGINKDAVIETSNKLKKVRFAYSQFESQIKGFDPTVHIHKLPGGAMGSSLEQAQKGGFLNRMPEILTNEIPKVHKELGNFWSVTPGSQIIWTTAVAHVLAGERYKNASDDLKNLLLGRYGNFPFKAPSPEIYQAVFGGNWRLKLKNEFGQEKIEPIDLATEKNKLENLLSRESTEEELVLYLQHPRDAVEFFKFEEKNGKTYVLPPEIWFREGGFEIGQTIEFKDYLGKHHQIVIATDVRKDNGATQINLIVDHHPQQHNFEAENKTIEAQKDKFDEKEINRLAQLGEIRASSNGVVSDVYVSLGKEVKKGDKLIEMEAMKMLHSITSAISGKIEEIAVIKNKEVKRGDLLLRIVPL